MNKTIIERERKGIDRMINFRLPRQFFGVGIILFFIAFGALIIAKIADSNVELVRIISRDMMLVGLLFCSLARDKEEDEMTHQLRAKSYSLAFILGVAYAILVPYIDYALDLIIKPNELSFHQTDLFPVLLFMLSIQVIFYRTFKKVL